MKVREVVLVNMDGSRNLTKVEEPVKVRELVVLVKKKGLHIVRW